MTRSTRETEATILRRPLSGEAVWTGAEIAGRSDWIAALSAAHQRELRGVLRAAEERRLGLADIGPETLPLPGMREEIERWVSELETGCGLVVVRGLDLGGLSLRQAGLVYFAIGRAMGRPIRQNARGHLLGHVRDTGRSIGDTDVRGYQTRIALPFHTDTSTDVLGLFCWRRAKSGGMSALAPLQTIYNEILRQEPELADTLHGPFHYDLREEEHADGGPFYTRVAATLHQGKFSMRHNSGYALTAQRFEGCPRLTESQMRVMALIDELAPRFALSVMLEEGDMLFLNNYAVMHSRTEFEDHAAPEQRRHLLRLWLHLYDGRPLPPEFDNRGGIVTTAEASDDGLWDGA